MFQLPEMCEQFSPDAQLRHMLAFEAALARAQAQAGVIPPDAAEVIAAACRHELYDVSGLHRDAAASGTVVIPLVRALTAHAGTRGAPFVHWGATSQDVIDTALMLAMRDGLHLLADELGRVAAECARLADAHRRTVMAGRTLLQHATPITFGVKAARWLALSVRRIRALNERRSSTLALQFGGAAGTCAVLGDAAPHVTRALGEILQLPVPDLPWHAERDRVGDIAAAASVAAGSMSKIATDIVLLAQTEVGEVSESAPGGSSAMPQKRNPVNATQAIAAARLCMGQLSVLMNAIPHEHERAAGSWQAEWVAVPELFGFAAGAVHHVFRSLQGLEVHTDRMRDNLARGGGTLMAESLAAALAPSLGRVDAHRLAGELARESAATGDSLQQVTHRNPHVRAALAADAIDRALDPFEYLGSSNLLIDRALAAYTELRS